MRTSGEYSPPGELHLLSQAQQSCLQRQSGASDCKMNRAILSALVLLFSHFSALEAASILGFAIVGGTSHQASLARIGLELVDRGHNFTLLLSSEDVLSHTRLAYGPFRSLTVLNFSGPAGVGTQEWRARMPRDPTKAGYNLNA